MIQRIQTVYLLLAIVVLAVCIALPIGRFFPEGMGTSATMYNLIVLTDNASLARALWQQPTPLLALLSVVIWIAGYAIFAFKNRKRQARLCTVGMVLLVVWYLLYFVYGYLLAPASAVFHIAFGVCLPFCAFVLLLLARRGILADERLVRAADRIR